MERNPPGLHPKATWNPETDRWETATIYGRSDVYSETFPNSGTMQNGDIYERPKLEPVTSVNESSFLPHLPTPTATDYKRDNYPQDNARRSPAITAVDTHFPQVRMLPYGDYADAVRSQESVSRPAPWPTIHLKGKYKVRAEFIEWMMDLPEGWVTNPDIGLSRSAQIKTLGNGVVPMQAEAALRTLHARNV